MFLAPLLILIIHLLQHLFDSVHHQHEIYVSPTALPSTKSIICVEADRQRLTRGLDEHRLVLQTTLSQKLQIAPSVRPRELLVNRMVANELSRMELGMRNVHVDAVVVGVGHKHGQLDRDLRVICRVHGNGVGYLTALAEERTDEGDGKAPTHHALVALQREGQCGLGHWLELEPPSGVEVNAERGGRHVLSDVVNR